MTPSIPIGIYRISNQDIQRGSFVLACIHTKLAELAIQRGYVGRGDCPGNIMPIGKVVYGLPGDTISVSSKGISVNGFLLSQSQALSVDRKFRAMPRWDKINVILDEDQWWLDAPHQRSFGSRYVGPFSSESIREVLIPVWIKRE